MKAADENTYHLAWKRGGNIAQVTWVGQNTMAWCSGLNLVFLDVPTNRVQIPRFPEKITKDGVGSISGHHTYQMFAYTDLHLKPRIHIYSYPSMTKISECVGGSMWTYLVTEFCGDYLVSWSSAPDFKLCFWSWRTGQRITSVDSILHESNAFDLVLRASYFTPNFLIQVGKSSGRLLIWERMICKGKSIVNHREIVLPKKPPIKHASWQPGANKNAFALIDHEGHIFLSDTLTFEITRIVDTQRCADCPNNALPSITWFRGGIVLRTTCCDIRFYSRKDPREPSSPWISVWSEKVSYRPRLLTSYPFQNDKLFFVTEEGHLYYVHIQENGQPAFELMHFFGGHYHFMSIVHPWVETVLAIDQTMDLSVIEAHGGLEIARMKLPLEGRIMCFQCHPHFPLLVVTSDCGEVMFVSMLHYLEPVILGKLKLQKGKLDLLKYSQSGRFVAVCHREEGVCYFLKVSLDKPIDVASRFVVPVKITDVLLYDTDSHLRLYALDCSSTNLWIGHRLLYYDLPEHHPESKRASAAWRYTRFYQKLFYMPGEPTSIISTSYLTRKLIIEKLNDWRELVCTDIMSNSHSLKQVNLWANKKCVITCSIDGRVIIRTGDIRQKNNISVFTHHSRLGGTHQAISSYNADLIFALGRDGSLAAMRRGEPDVSPQDLSPKLYTTFFSIVHIHRDSALLKLLDQEVVKFLEESSKAIAHHENSEGLTWLQWKQQQNLEEERLRYAHERGAVLETFMDLKSQIVNLLNANEKSDELYKLPISAFDLNKRFRDKTIKIAKDEREEEKLRLERSCHERDRISDHIQSEYWNHQVVLGRSIFGIFKQLEVTNYVVGIDQKEKEELVEFYKFERIVNLEVTGAREKDVFDLLIDPNTIDPADKQSMKQDAKSIAGQSDFKSVADTIFPAEVSDDSDARRTTHRFIEPYSPYYPQCAVYSYPQIKSGQQTMSMDMHNLRLHFNEKFNELYAVKEREMVVVYEMIDRIFFILSELKTMFGITIEGSYEYPEWLAKEKPERIIEVKDSEISAQVYVSNSYQELMRSKEEEEDKMRRAKLADNYRDRALQRMMDGVLEVKWEDLIKHDPPEPECKRIGKRPEEYTNDDKLAIKQYEQELERLVSERLKYKNILLADYETIQTTLKNSIERFNKRLGQLHLMRMKVQAAVQQLNLVICRQITRYKGFIKSLDQVEEMKVRVKEKYDKLSVFSTEIKFLDDLDQQLRDQLEELLAKDKIIEKRFRAELTGVSKNVQMVMLSQFRKTPRTILKTRSSSEVYDLSESILVDQKKPYMTNECREYLKNLNFMDHCPVTLAGTIEPAQWKTVVTFRRQKIEQDLKKRSLNHDLDYVGFALDKRTRLMDELNKEIEDMRHEINRRRIEIKEGMIDSPLQLVLKVGQIELADAKGEVGDSENAVMVPKCQIDTVNEAIIAVGRQKVRWIDQCMKFEKNIVYEQWVDRCLKTELKFANEELYYAKVAMVTRKIREYIAGISKDFHSDDILHHLTRHIQATKNKEEKLLHDWRIKLHDVLDEITILQDKNQRVDHRIEHLNVDRWEMELKRDVVGEARQENFKEDLFKILAKRSALVRKLVNNHQAILELREKQRLVNADPMSDNEEKPTK
ncbi:hypothetical protein TKK_0009726 [Trichogramma kaykai]